MCPYMYIWVCICASICNVILPKGKENNYRIFYYLWTQGSLDTELLEKNPNPK